MVRLIAGVCLPIILFTSTALAWQPIRSPYSRAINDGKKAFAAKQYDVAEKHFLSAAALGREEDPSSLAYAAALDHLGSTYAQRRKYKDAEKVLTQARDIIIERSDRFHPDVLQTLQTLALVQRVTKQYDQATETSIWMLKIVEVHFGKDHLNVAAIHSNLAAIEQQRGKFAKAEEYLSKAITIREKELKADDAVLGESYRDMGNTLLALKKFEDAEKWYDKMIASAKKRAPDSLEVAQALQTKSRLYEFTKTFKNALPLIERAHVIRGRLQGYDHVEVGQTAFTLSRLYVLTRDFRAAEPYSRMAMTIFKTKLGETHAFHLVALLNHAALLEATGRSTEAKQYRQKVERLKKQAAGK